MRPRATHRAGLVRSARQTGLSPLGRRKVARTRRSNLAPMAAQLPVMPTVRLGERGPMVSRLGLGLAALGRPAYITGGRDRDLPDRSVSGMRARTRAMLDAAYDAGIRYADAARSYGLAEEFLGGWLEDRSHPDVIVG